MTAPFAMLISECRHRRPIGLCSFSCFNRGCLIESTGKLVVNLRSLSPTCSHSVSAFTPRPIRAPLKPFTPEPVSISCFFVANPSMIKAVLILPCPSLFVFSLVIADNAVHLCRATSFDFLRDAFARPWPSMCRLAADFVCAAGADTMATSCL